MEAKQRYIHGHHPEHWTTLIPAAGRGSRLGYAKPKILFPILGRTILDRLIDLLVPYVHQFVFVLSPAGVGEVSPLLEKRIPGKFQIAIQDEPRGMADAIKQGLSAVTTPFTFIIWGDQVAINPDTVEMVMSIHEGTPGAKLTLPLIQRDKPYVHYELDAAGNLTSIRQKREGDTMPLMGESDCGVFACETKRLREVFNTYVRKDVGLGSNTGEWNFLPMLPEFETGGESVQALRLESTEETVGVNDSTDVAFLEDYFQKQGL